MGSEHVRGTKCWGFGDESCYAVRWFLTFDVTIVLRAVGPSRGTLHLVHLCGWWVIADRIWHAHESNDGRRVGASLHFDLALAQEKPLQSATVHRQSKAGEVEPGPSHKAFQSLQCQWWYDIIYISLFPSSSSFTLLQEFRMVTAFDSDPSIVVMRERCPVAVNWGMTGRGWSPCLSNQLATSVQRLQVYHWVLPAFQYGAQLSGGIWGLWRFGRRTTEILLGVTHWGTRTIPKGNGSWPDGCCGELSWQDRQVMTSYQRSRKSFAYSLACWNRVPNHHGWGLRQSTSLGLKMGQVLPCCDSWRTAI